MIDEPAAREIAQTNLSPDEAVLGVARELEQGWYFPCVMKVVDTFAGVIVNKADGRCIHVMVDSPTSRDPTLYDRGYQFVFYDLVVLSVEDLEQAVHVLHALHPTIVDTYYKFDRVYRVRRGMTEDEIRDRIQGLPSVFTVALTYQIDRLEEARDEGWFSFRLLEYRENR